MDHSKALWAFVVRQPTDYTDYGGEVERWSDPHVTYPDCSCGCRFACYLEGSGDWLVCANPASPRAGLLTWEHQAGYRCYAPEDRDDNEDEITLVFPELGELTRRVRRIEEYLRLGD
jgi:hypothetical protein